MLLSNKNSTRRGATAVEMAFVASLTALLMFGLLDYCLLTYTNQVVEAAAREGARYAIVNVTDTTMVSDTQAVVKSFMGGLDQKMTGYNCNVYLADANGNNIGAATSAQFGQYVCVEVTITYVPISPGLDYLKTFTIRSRSSMGSEAN